MNIYLIASESFNLINDEVNKIVKSSLNVVKYDGRVNPLNEVINEASYYSLESDMKYIIYKESQLFKSKAKKEDSEEDLPQKDNKEDELFLKFINSNIENRTIIFTISYMPDQRKKLFKELSLKGNIIIIKPLNKKEMVYKCQDILKEHKYILDYDTANYIVDNSYVNYDIMLSQLEKVYLLLKPGRIGINDLKNVISLAISDNIFNYINAIINRDLLNASKSMRYFEQLKIEPIMVLMMLYKEFNVLLLLKCGQSPKEVQSLFQKQDWQMNNYMQNVNNYNKTELKKIITILQSYDYKYKCGKIDRSVILNLLTIELCE